MKGTPGRPRPYHSNVGRQNAGVGLDVKGKTVRAYVTAMFVGLATAMALTTGCDDREAAIRSYSAPKDAVVTPATGPAASQAAPLAAEAGAQDLPFKWTLPSGWKQDPQPRAMRVATVNVEADGKRGELIVTRFRAGGFGSLLDNLNRWRQQVGLEPLTDEKAATPETTKVGGVDAKVYDFTGPAAGGNPAKRNRVVMAQTSAGDVWFFRFNGPADFVESQKAAFDQLLQSIEFTK